MEQLSGSTSSANSISSSSSSYSSFSSSSNFSETKKKKSLTESIKRRFNRLKHKDTKSKDKEEVNDNGYNTGRHHSHHTSEKVVQVNTFIPKHKEEPLTILQQNEKAFIDATLTEPKIMTKRSRSFTDKDKDEDEIVINGKTVISKYDEKRIVQTVDVLRGLEKAARDITRAHKQNNVDTIRTPIMMNELDRIKIQEIEFEENLRVEIEDLEKENKQEHESYLANEKQFNDKMEVLMSQAREVIAKRLEQKRKEEETTRTSIKTNVVEGLSIKREAPFITKFSQFLLVPERLFILLVLCLCLALQLICWIYFKDNQYHTMMMMNENENSSMSVEAISLTPYHRHFVEDHNSMTMFK